MTNERSQRQHRWRQFSLRRLMIVVAVAPPLLAVGSVAWRQIVEAMRPPTRDMLMLTVTPRLTILEEEPSLLGLDVATETIPVEVNTKSDDGN